MAKIKKLHPWYNIKLRNSNKDKNSENDEMSVTDFASQLNDSAQLAGKEDLTNKATDFATLNDTLYPTVKAVETRISSGTVIESNVTMSARTILSGTNLGANADIIDLAINNTTQAVTASNIDWSTGVQFTKTLSAGLTLTFSNLVLNKCIIFKPSGAYTITLPSSCIQMTNSDTYDVAKSEFIFMCENAASGSEVVKYIIRNTL